MRSAYRSPEKQRAAIMEFIREKAWPVDRLTIARSLGYQTASSVHESLKKLVKDGALRQIQSTRPNGTVKFHYVPTKGQLHGFGVFDSMTSEELEAWLIRSGFDGYL